MTLAKNPIYHERSKYIGILFDFIREHTMEKNVESLMRRRLKKTDDQVTDIFAKPLTVDLFHKLKSLLGTMNELQLSLKRDRT